MGNPGQRTVFEERLKALRAEVASWTDEDRERARAALAAELERVDAAGAFWDAGRGGDV